MIFPKLYFLLTSSYLPYPNFDIWCLLIKEDELFCSRNVDREFNACVDRLWHGLYPSIVLYALFSYWYHMSLSHRLKATNISDTFFYWCYLQSTFIEAQGELHSASLCSQQDGTSSKHCTRIRSVEVWNQAEIFKKSYVTVKIKP